MTSDPHHEDRSVVIGLRDVWDELRLVTDQCSRLSTKLDIHLAQTTTQLQTLAAEAAATNERHNALERRLRTLEQKPTVTPLAMWTGITTIATVTGVVVAVLTALVKVV